jgi:hypothetical protein
MVIANSNKSTPRELMAEVELRLASTPGFETQLRNFLPNHPVVPYDVAEPASGLEYYLASTSDMKCRFVAGDFVFGTVDPPRYWNRIIGALMSCEDPLPDISKGKNTKTGSGKVTHQSLIMDLAKRIGNFIFFATIDMSTADILKFLPEKVVEIHFPATGATITMGKKEKELKFQTQDNHYGLMWRSIRDGCGVRSSRLPPTF